MDLASCTTSVVTCADTGTTTGAWPVAGEVGVAVSLALLVGLAALAWLRYHRRRPARPPQRRAHVSAEGELLRVDDLRGG